MLESEGNLSAPAADHSAHVALPHSPRERSTGFAERFRPFCRSHAWLLILAMGTLTAALSSPVRAQSNPSPQGNTTPAQQGAPTRATQQTTQQGPTQQLREYPAPEGGQAGQVPQGSPPQPAQQAAPTATQQPTSAPRQPETYSVGALFIVAVVFAVLGLLFFLQLYWSNKLDQTGYLGTLYKDTLEEIEYKRLKSECDNRLNTGEYHDEVGRDVDWLSKNPKPVPPEGFDPWSVTRRPGSRGTPLPGLPLSARGSGLPTSATGSLGGSLGGDPTNSANSANQDEQRNTPDPKIIEYDTLRGQWEEKLVAQAWSNYYRDLDGKRARARELSSKAINVDLSILRGRGAEFVLGFTTIVAIVFAAVALGVLGKLDSQQIGTLFAAIAGYVLGRASATRGSSEPEQARTPETGSPMPQRQQARAAGQST